MCVSVQKPQTFGGNHVIPTKFWPSTHCVVFLNWKPPMLFVLFVIIDRETGLILTFKQFTYILSQIEAIMQVKKTQYTPEILMHFWRSQYRDTFFNKQSPNSRYTLRRISKDTQQKRLSFEQNVAELFLYLYRNYTKRINKNWTIWYKSSTRHKNKATNTQKQCNSCTAKHSLIVITAHHSFEP